MIINLYLELESFDNDARSLLMAFYPGCRIERILMPEDASEDADLIVKVCLAENGWLYQTLKFPETKDQAEEVFESEKKGIRQEEKKETKTIAKCMLYRLLSQVCRKKLPWGTLTGIRPTKIARQMMDDGSSDQEIREYMEQEMLCSSEKTNLSLEIAKRERTLLEQIDYEDGYSLYIGIPFCPTTCAYCSFTSYPLERFAGQVDSYLDALEKEIDFTAVHFAGKKLNTIYFGGGTPTTLEPEQLDRLLTKVEHSFDLSDLREMTVEAGRPDSITKEKLEVIRKHRVTRISINPQTMKDETLKLIGRRHTVAQIREAYALARTLGFDNINMDIIIGLPDESKEDIEQTLIELSEMKPDNLTVHTLAIKRAARMNTQKEAFASVKSINSDDVMQMTEAYARKMGMVPYYLYRQKNMTGNMENVGYAMPGKEGIYNILIMEEVQTIVALGAGAVTKAVFGSRIERCENVKDIKTYLERIDDMIERKRALFHFEEEEQ